MTDIAGLIYAGGESSRFGADKTTALLQGQRLIDHVAERFRPQVNMLAVAGPATVSGAQCLDDGVHAGKGPLAGLLAGLKWASSLPEITWLATAPCDVPLLPTNLIALLTKNLTDTPTVPNVEGRWQPGGALWPISALPFIENTLVSGDDLSLHAALKHLQAETIETPSDALDGSFTNINTRDELIQLEQRLPQSHG